MSALASESSVARNLLLQRLGLRGDSPNPGVSSGTRGWHGSGVVVSSLNPATNETIACVTTASAQETEAAVASAVASFESWHQVPALSRGQIVRKIGDKIRHHIQDLGQLISLETGRTLSEAIGELIMFVSVTDSAFDLSRKIPDQISSSEITGHAQLELWNPYGVVGVFTGPHSPGMRIALEVALALIAGNVIVWTPEPTAQLTVIAFTKLIQSVLEENSLSQSICTLVTGGPEISLQITRDTRIPQVSFTDSRLDFPKVSTDSRSACPGVHEMVRARSNKGAPEWRGTSTIILHQDADLKLAIRAAVFACVASAGPRCRHTTRRLIVHQSIYDTVLSQLKQAYNQVKVGDPLASGSLLGPLHSPNAVVSYVNIINRIKEKGGRVEYGGEIIEGNFVKPTIVTGLEPEDETVLTETFAPIVYVTKFDDLDEAIRQNNLVKHDMTTLFTRDIGGITKWIGGFGAECSLVSINGAQCRVRYVEEAGPFDLWGSLWKRYMQRTMCAINHSNELPLVQGIKLE